MTSAVNVAVIDSWTASLKEEWEGGEEPDRGGEQQGTLGLFTAEDLHIGWNMSAEKTASPCNKFQANIFNKTKCQNCFKSRELHLLTDRDMEQVTQLKSI